jgi:hypothetical protein
MVENRNTLHFIKVGITSNHTAWNLVWIILYTQRKTHVKLPTLTWLGKVGGINMVCHILAIVVYSLRKAHSTFIRICWNYTRKQYRVECQNARLSIGLAL